MTFFTTYCEYAATGEGSTLMIAISRTAIASERLFKKHFNEFFHRGMETVEGLPEKSKGLIPSYIQELLDDPRDIVVEYYQCHHYNLS